MGWNAVEDRNERMLRRIIALLLALAGLAESASLRSPAVRAAVLWLLRPGEEIATAYLASMAGRSATPPPVSTRDSAADALRLGLVFRALAAALAAFLDDTAALQQGAFPPITRLLLTANRAHPAKKSPHRLAERRDSS